MSPKLSIVIPTYKRPEILKKCLEHIAAQTIVNDLEMIVVSDGPDEQVKQLVESYPLPATRKPLFFSVPKSQQGVARNEGVKHATADRVLFIGDDIFLEPTACEKHVNPLPNPSPVHGGGAKGWGHGILGFTTWDPTLDITPVMKWLEQSGWQFGYPFIQKYAHSSLPKDMQHKFTYTSHISLPTEVARAHPFRTDVTMYGWEDIEWGMRLRDAGVELFYEPDAKALHHHRITMEESLKRMETLGRSAKELSEKLPEFDRVPKGCKLFVYKILSMFPTMAGRHRKSFLSSAISLAK